MRHASLAAFAAVMVLAAASATTADRIRIAVQRTGTLAWELDVIRAHDIDRKANLQIETIELASTEAGKIALKGGSADLMLSDWLWVARERALGAKLLFYPYSSAVGRVMVKADSPLKQLDDLKGKVLAVAGGPIDKSWLIIRAAALRRGVDLKREASLQYGAPPLMFQKLQQGEADAGLNFWNFCARLETLGYRSLIDVREAEKELGLKQPVAMIGYVFSEQFAAGHRDAINRFVKIAQAANDLLRQSDGEWDALRPLIKADDEATFNIMRQRTREGMPRRSIDEEASDARLLFRTLAQIGGTELVGPAGELDAGLYYYPSAAHGE